MTAGKIEIIEATTAEEFVIAKALFIEYQQFLNVDLCFQQFEKELASLADMYSAPTGSLLLAVQSGKPVGCVALRYKQAQVCEMKRLYVQDRCRNSGIGKLLVQELLLKSITLGYKKIILDTLERLSPALHVYTQFGFRDCEPYYGNPLQGVRFMQRVL
ncbi:MAG TPA: GNAT family N-acetyltransferase [Phnomibacter sp.]|nr:GNAT family N-acetyltransferase [Phnomibacter sp.]